MSQLIYFGGAGGSQPANPNIDYEFFGWGSGGVGTLLTANASANTKGAWVSLGTASDDLCALEIVFGASNGSGIRAIVDIGVGPSGSQTVIVPDIYVVTSAVGTTEATDWAEAPRKVAAGEEIWARMSASAGSSTQRIAIRGVQASDALPPGFDNCEVVLGDVANTRAGPTDLPMNGTRTQLVSSTSRQYGALWFTPGQNASTPDAQELTLKLATGGSGSEVDIYARRVVAVNGNPVLKTGGERRLIRKTIPSGTRLSAMVEATTTTGAAIRAGIHGFW